MAGLILESEIYAQMCVFSQLRWLSHGCFAHFCGTLALSRRILMWYNSFSGIGRSQWGQDAVKPWRSGNSQVKCNESWWVLDGLVINSTIYLIEPKDTAHSWKNAFVLFLKTDMWPKAKNICSRIATYQNNIVIFIFIWYWGIVPSPVCMRASQMCRHPRIKVPHRRDSFFRVSFTH